MAGEAKTSSFMLGTATVMLGAPADLFDLTPEEHSVGLVKNFRITGEPGYTELTQGVKNQIVYSVMTSNRIRAQMEVYEYTSKNIAYSMGLEGAALDPLTVVGALASPTTNPDTDLVLGTGEGSTFSVGDWVMLQGDIDDKAFVAKVTAVAVDTLTISPGVKEVWAAGTNVYKMNQIEFGSKEDQPYLAAKVVGTLADGAEVVMLFPKIRISAGFSLGFVTENFDNMPYEFTFFDVVSTDPFYTDFRNGQGKLFTRT